MHWRPLAMDKEVLVLKLALGLIMGLIFVLGLVHIP